jgi:cytoskeletal protein RodZ
VSGYEPEDPSEAPTGLYNYSGEEQGSPERSSWYRNPIVLVTLGLFVAILLGLAFYLLADQTNGTGGTTQTQTPMSPTTSAVTSTPSSEVTTTSEPVAPPETTTMTGPPTTTEPTAGTSPTTSTSVDEGRHHHHHHGGGTF